MNEPLFPYSMTFHISCWRQQHLRHCKILITVVARYVRVLHEDQEKTRSEKSRNKEQQEEETEEKVDIRVLS